MHRFCNFNTVKSERNIVSVSKVVKPLTHYCIKPSIVFIKSFNSLKQLKALYLQHNVKKAETKTVKKKI